MKSGVEVLENQELDLKAIGYFNYLSLSSRQDIMCVASILSSYSQKPTKLARRAVVIVFAYLLGTKSGSFFIDSIMVQKVLVQLLTSMLMRLLKVLRKKN